MCVAMRFGKDLGNWWWISGLVGLVSAAIIAFWSPGASLALAALGAGLGFASGFGKPSFLTARDSARRVLSRLTGVRIRATQDESESDSEPVLLRGPASRRAPQAAGSPGPARTTPSGPVEPPPRPAHTWLLKTRARGASDEKPLRPQHAFRLAADPALKRSEPEQPGEQDQVAEVIDLPSVMRNLERKARDKQGGGPIQAAGPDASEAAPVMMDFEEVHRRLKSTRGEWPLTNSRLDGSGPLEERRSGSTRASARGRFDAPGGRSFGPGQPLTKATVPGDGSGLEVRPSFHSEHGFRASDVGLDADHAGAVSDEAPAATVSEPSIRPPLSTLDPSSRSNAAGALRLPERANFRSSAFPSLLRDNGPMETPVVYRAPESFLGSSANAKDSESLSSTWANEGLDCSPEPACGHIVMHRELPFRGAERAGAFSIASIDGGIGFPPLSLLYAADSMVAPMSQDDLIDGGILIEEKLAEFRVKVNVQDAYAGPVITRYEVQPAVGVRGGQVVSLMKDLARALGVASIRMVETIPGKTCMGLELPNPRRQMIRLSEVLSTEAFQRHESKLAMALGKDIIGEPVVVDLAKAPHLLVAGTTGSGKSVGVNAMILSLLYRATPDEVRFVMIDPKMLELSIYDGIPHLLTPVVTDMKLAANALTWCVGEMERRYRLMSGLKVRNLAGYNLKIREAAEAGELLLDPYASTEDTPVSLQALPYVVVVVDELADLMMVAGKKIEELIARLAQKARAAGIHLIIATQRPSVDVITGLIKANIPTRIAFQVSSKIDSRTILDQMGAECLLGQGDMLYLPPGSGYPQRVHGAFVADEEVYAVAEYLKQFGEPQYVEGVLEGMAGADDGGVEADRFDEETDPLYDEAVAFVINSRRASISAVQRQLRIGYNRAARLVEQMEAAGLVSGMESNGNRTVLVPARQE